MWKQFAYLKPRLAKPLESMLWPKAKQLLALQLGYLLSLGEGLRHRLAVHLGQFRLWIKRFEMRRSTGLIQKDHPLGFGLKMQRIDHPL